jgi:hypothetical protein
VARERTGGAICGVKSHLELRTGPAELPHFYDVLAASYRRKRTPIQGYAAMRELTQALRDRTEAVVLWRAAKPSTDELVWQACWHAPRMCSLRTTTDDGQRTT